MFFSDDSELEPIVKKRKDSAFDLITLDLELVEENKTKRAAIILNEMFNSNNVCFSDETKILLVHDETSRSRDSKHFVQFTTTYKKLTCQSVPKSSVNLLYQPTWFIVLTQRKFWISFTVKMKKKPYQNNGSKTEKTAGTERRKTI